MRLVIPLLLLVVLAVPSAAATQELWGEVSILGGAGAAASVTGVPARTGDTAWLLDFIRHHASDSPGDWVNAVQDLQDYVRFAEAIAASPVAQPAGLHMPKGVSQDPNQLNRALQPLGLRAQQRRGALEVTLENLDDNELAWVKALGLDRNAVIAALNAGEPATVTIRRSLVPLPLPIAWQQELRLQTLTIIDILGRRRSALRYAGLVALDDETLRFVGDRPELFRWLGDDNAAAATFAAFGSSVHVRNGRVETPGGPAAAESWDRLVGLPQSDAQSFVRRLFERDDGRLAAFYDAVSRLDRKRQAFALGGHLQASERADFLERLYANASGIWSANWNLTERPLDRPPFDPATALLLMDVRDDGLALPSWLASLVERVADSEDWPDDPRETDRGLRDQPADAVWTISWLFARPAQTTDRFKLLRFAQRQFSETDRTAAPSVEIALRCFKDLPALALSLERMGVRSPEVLARVAWAGRRMTDAGDASDIGPLLARWQSALALLEQIQRQVRIDERPLALLLTSLAEQVPPHRERSRGLVATWLINELIPTFVTPDGSSLERQALTMFAGTGRRTRVPVSWEGLSYVLDEAGPVVRSALEIREARPGPTLDDLVSLHAASVKLAGVTSKSADLVSIATTLRSLERAFSTLPATGNRPHPMIEAFDEAVEAIERQARLGEAERARRELPKILDAVDAITDAVIPALVYALAASPSRQPAELLAEAWIWHRVVPVPPESTMRWKLQPWRLPGMTARSGGGVRLAGSMLALDVALAYATLPTTGASGVEASIEAADRLALVQSIPLHAPGLGRDASAVLAGVTAGRRRLADWKNNSDDGVARRQALVAAGIADGRANLIVWEAARQMPAYDGLTALDAYRLGTEAPLSREWGGASTRLDGCLCLAAPERRSLELFRGRIGGGMTTAAADLSLALLEQISALGLPAELLRPLLPIAAAHWFDNVHQRDAYDWEALTTWPRRLSRLEIEEYLLRLTSEGYLVAVEGPASK